MILVVCIDDNGGMMFNHRRQSRDRAVIDDILNNVSKCVKICEYSKPLFENSGGEYIVAENFLETAVFGDCCFVENCGIADYIDKASKLVVYKWNRRYPSDFSLDVVLFDDRLKLCGRTEFKGNSHEKITKEVYEICEE
ncbi:MAG: hypothetical protein E7562_03135 [Ruminococcaceae bacterium]|nr:hypothetical protein [Oscillospiraceae bacterium]